MCEGKSLVRPLLLLSFFFFSSCCSFVSGHTNLANPLGYNPIDCNPPECRGPVPPAWPNGEHKARNSPERPAAYWKRGGKVKIKWHRNNHGGGFVRFSLVPVSKMNDWEWHKITAFHYGCFEAYRYRCYGFAQCGSDNDGNGYYQEIEIPNVFPDGKYVFVMVWYGGVKYDRTNAMFSNYHCASHVRIKGGAPVSGWYKPRFEPVPSSYSGEQGEPVPKGMCLTTALWVGECQGRPCYHMRAKATIPGIFQNPYRPEGILSSKIQRAINET